MGKFSHKLCLYTMQGMLLISVDKSCYIFPWAGNHQRHILCGSPRLGFCCAKGLKELIICTTTHCETLVRKRTCQWIPNKWCWLGCNSTILNTSAISVFAKNKYIKNDLSPALSWVHVCIMNWLMCHPGSFFWKAIINRLRCWVWGMMYRLECSWVFLWH